ncbi:MAG: histidine phosphatase family protein [Pseudomonadales bacterium]
MWRKILCVLIIVYLPIPIASADNHTVVYLVRHAEKELDQGKDPNLTEKGLYRAGHYADSFRDAGITHIYSTDYKRTQATVKPLADLLGLPVISYDPDYLGKLANTFRSAQGIYFVSGHSDTTPELVTALGGTAGREIDEDNEFDRVYQIIINADKTVYTHRLRSLPK